MGAWKGKESTGMNDWDKEDEEEEKEGGIKPILLQGGYIRKENTRRQFYPSLNCLRNFT